MARPKGSVNKPKLALMKRLEEKFGPEWNPVIDMAEHAFALSDAARVSRKREDRESAIAALDKVAVYVTPKLKQQEVDLTSSDGSMSPPKGIRLIPVSAAYLKAQMAEDDAEEPTGGQEPGPEKDERQIDIEDCAE